MSFKTFVQKFLKPLAGSGFEDTLKALGRHGEGGRPMYLSAARIPATQ